MIIFKQRFLITRSSLSLSDWLHSSLLPLLWLDLCHLNVNKKKKDGERLNQNALKLLKIELRKIVFKLKDEAYGDL